MIDRWTEALRRADEELGHIMTCGWNLTAICLECSARLIGHQAEDGTVQRVTGSASRLSCEKVLALQEVTA